MPHQLSRTGRILVVDDQSANVRVVKALLERHGYVVTAASNGKDALEAATGETPDLLLLDMMMPGMDGFELLAALRELPGFRQVRRMTAAVGLPTLRLVRIAVGGHQLDTLAPGHWRELPVVSHKD